MSEFDRLLADPSSEPLPAVRPGRVLEPDRIIQPGRIDSPDLPPRRYTGPVPPPLRPATTVPANISLPRRDVGPRLRVDWPACKAHGLCAELVPERVGLDEWGYPIVDRNAVPPELLEAARKAVMSCPTVALRLVDPG
jgi:ferredoxin